MLLRTHPNFIEQIRKEPGWSFPIFGYHLQRRRVFNADIKGQIGQVCHLIGSIRALELTLAAAVIGQLYQTVNHLVVSV